MCIFIIPYFHYKNLFFTAVKNSFRIFTGLLPDYFLLKFRTINIIISNHQFLITDELFKMTESI